MHYLSFNYIIVMHALELYSVQRFRLSFNMGISKKLQNIGFAEYKMYSYTDETIINIIKYAILPTYFNFSSLKTRTVSNHRS